jgi:hypothetical protein
MSECTFVYSRDRHTRYCIVHDRLAIENSEFRQYLGDGSYGYTLVGPLGGLHYGEGCQRLDRVNRWSARAAEREAMAEATQRPTAEPSPTRIFASSGSRTERRGRSTVRRVRHAVKL